MFARRNRLSSSEVRDTMRRGRPFHSSYAMARVGRRAEEGAPWGASVVAGARVSKKAVLRNRYKRIGREVVKDVLREGKPGTSLVLVLKPAIKELPMQRVGEELSSFLSQIFKTKR